VTLERRTGVRSLPEANAGSGQDSDGEVREDWEEYVRGKFEGPVSAFSQAVDVLKVCLCPVAHASIHNRTLKNSRWEHT